MNKELRERILAYNRTVAEKAEKAQDLDVIVSAIGAKKLLLPVNQCGNLVAGTQVMSLSKVMEEAVELLRTLCAPN